MGVHANVIANKFIALANEKGTPLTNMQLQKLVYIAQGFTLAIKNQPLYFNNTHAWQWGPVVPNLYKNLQKYGSGLVKESISVDNLDEEAKQIPPEHIEIIEAVWNYYGSYTGGQLSSITCSSPQ